MGRSARRGAHHWHRQCCARVPLCLCCYAQKCCYHRVTTHQHAVIFVLSVRREDSSSSLGMAVHMSCEQIAFVDANQPQASSESQTMRRFYEPQAARRLRLPRHMVSHGALQGAYRRLRLPRIDPTLAAVTRAEAAAFNTCVLASRLSVTS